MTTDVHCSVPASGRLAGRVDRDALRDVWPMLIGVAPFGLLIGVTIGRMHLGAGLGLTSAMLFFGGSGHFAALTLLQTGAGPLAVVAAVAVVNARLAIYAAALQPRFREHPARFRWVAPQVLIDQTYALATARPDLSGARFRRYRRTAGAAFAVVWLGSHVAGLLLGPLLPEHSPLEIAAPAVFVGLLAPQLVRRPALAAAGVAALVAATASVFPVPEPPQALGQVVVAAHDVLVLAELARRRHAAEQRGAPTEVTQL
jgi:predicted branched-subunit amino acid permease